MHPLLIMTICVVFVYICSRLTLRNIFILLRRTFYKDGPVYMFIALFFFPGTLLHEMAHYIAAIVLLLEVKSVHLLPEWKGDELKLGKVIYIRRDFVRGLLVGIAPVIAGVIFLLFFSVFVSFPAENVWINIVSVYVLLVVTTMMFSSKQDLIDFIYVLPGIAVLALILFMFNVKVTDLIVGISRLSDIHDISGTMLYVEKINRMLYITLIVHTVVIVLLSLLNRRRR